MNILFLSPHTDDVELGAGGTLIKFKERGDDIYWVVFSTPRESLPDGTPGDTLEHEFKNAASTAGLSEKNCKIYDFQVRRLHEHRQEILEELIKIRRAFSPELVVGPSLHDFHQDHQVVANEMLRAFKNTASIISYELPWNHVEFTAQLFVRLTEHELDKKIALLKNYRTQIDMKRPYFREEFIKGWARMRGVQIHAEFAEAYEVQRWIFP